MLERDTLGFTVYIAVLSFFSCGISVIEILTCGIAVPYSPAVCRLDFRRSPVSGLPSPRSLRGRSAGSFPEQRQIIELRQYAVFLLTDGIR